MTDLQGQVPGLGADGKLTENQTVALDFIQSDLPGYVPPDLPRYTEEPQNGEIKLESALGEFETRGAKEIKVTVFMVNFRKKQEGADWKSFGRLEIGNRVEFGVSDSVMWYKPPGAGGLETDISHDIRVLHDLGAVDTRVHYVKQNNPSLSNYSFDIIVENLGTDDASFVGTVDYGNGDLHELSGQGVTVKNKTISASHFSLDAPTGLDGTPAGLREISPFSTSDNTAAGTKYKEDTAQVFGDRLMQKIMFWALDDKTRKELLPPTQELSQKEMSILEGSKDYFRRMAIHVLADEIKKTQSVSPEYKDKIKFKAQNFVSMLCAKETPSDLIEGKDGKPIKAVDPVEVYGWDRKTNGAEIEKLRTQFTTASMKCYQMGYIKKCPQWAGYMKHPLYWFRYLSTYLTSESFLISWRINAQDRSEMPGTMTISDEIAFWENKLSLLKHAASDDEAKEMNIAVVTSCLLAEAQQAAAFTRKLDEQFLQDIEHAYDAMKEQSGKGYYQNHFAKVSKDAHEIHGSLLTETSEIMAHLADPDSWLNEKITQWVWHHSPPDKPIKKLSLGQYYEALKDEAGMFDPDQTKISKAWNNTKAFGEKMKSSMKGIFGKVSWDWKKMFVYGFQVCLKGAALVALVYSLVRACTDKSVPWQQLGMNITMAASQALFLLRWGVLKLVQGPIVGNQIQERLAGWFARGLAESKTIATKLGEFFVVHFDKIIRVVGMIGCCFSLYNSFVELAHSNDLEPEYRTSFQVYQVLQITLGCLEFVCMGVELYGVFTHAASGVFALAGPAALYLGLAALTVTAVYWIFFAPKPGAEVWNFLKGEGKSVGSYFGD